MIALLPISVLLPALLAQLAAITIAFMDPDEQGGPPQTDPYGGG